MSIRTVIFDWGGTLTPWHTIEPRAAWAAAVGDDELAERLSAAEAELWQRAKTEHRSGSLTEVYAAAGLEHTDDMLAAFSEWWEPHTLLDPEAPMLFDALRERGIRIGVLSNTLWTRAEHERIFARDGVLDRIDGAVYSSEIPWTKPHPEAFRAALAAVAVDDPAELDPPSADLRLDRSLRSGRSSAPRRAFGAPASSLRSRGGGLFAQALIASVVVPRSVPGIRDVCGRCQ